MEHAPEIDWALARRITRLAPGRLPDLDRRDLQRLVACLRVTARRAGEISASALGVDSVGAGTISVVDWTGWGAAVRDMADAGMSDLGLRRRPPGALRTHRGVGGGLVAGVGLRIAGPRLIGQYDAYTGSDTLFLLAPNIVNLERAHGFVPADFRLWVSLHEQTHALQFRAAPWLRDHLVCLGRRVLETEDGDDIAGLVATMTFLEGHADHTADTAGRARIRTVGQLRRAFHRTPGTLSRIAGVFDKGAQYRNGLEFCTQVTRKGGRKALRDAFLAPQTLPRPDEIADPPAWLRRMRGQA